LNAAPGLNSYGTICQGDACDPAQAAQINVHQDGGLLRFRNTGTFDFYIGMLLRLGLSLNQDIE